LFFRLPDLDIAGIDPRDAALAGCIERVALVLERAAAFIPMVPVRFRRAPSVPMFTGHCHSPFGFFPFLVTTHASLKLWLILPEAGLRSSISLPQ
jgi:hypothetical protein